MEKKSEKNILWFSEITKADVKLVGGKGANLGEMHKSKFPVPPGFAITVNAYEYFLRDTGLKDKIYETLSTLNVENTKELEGVASKIQEMIVQAKMPEEVEKEIIGAYDILNSGDFDETTNEIATKILKLAKDNIFVAVRSSATSEDTAQASFAGQNETFLNIKGKYEVVEAVKKCFASLFTARSIYYRIKKGFKHENVLIAVIVQKMINSDKSGVIFSHDPMSKDNNVVIESVFGLGEGIVSGRIKPDYYLVNKNLEIVKKETAEKKTAIVRNSSGNTITIHLTEEKAKTQVLDEKEIKKLAKYAIELEKHYNKPQDIEFAIDTNEIYIVQTRPITTFAKDKREEIKTDKKILLSGLAASPGIAVGQVLIVRDMKDLEKIRKGNILVTKMTNPDMVVTMQKSSGIVTDEGGLTCHAAIVSREMGIPAVVGTGKATELLKDGMMITVDAYEGKIYSGEVKESQVQEIKQAIKTKTRIKIGIDLPSAAERASKTGIREIGLLRLEGIIAESGKHPLAFLNTPEEYEKIIYNGINKISSYFDEIWIRTSDIRSDEYSNLQGAPKIKEQNPMLGMHGIRASLKYPRLLEAELKAIIKIADKKRVGIMLPQVINLDELKKVKNILLELIKSSNSREIKLGVMIETPAAVQIIPKLCAEGIDFISLGTNDLTQYTLAIDRGNQEVQYLYDEMHSAVLKQIAYVISTCKKFEVETSICGQAANDIRMVEFLVKNNIDSLTVNPDRALEISKFVKNLEDKGLRGIDLKTSSNKNQNMPKKKQEVKVEEKKPEPEQEKIEEKKKSEEWPDIDVGVDVFGSSLS